MVDSDTKLSDLVEIALLYPTVNATTRVDVITVERSTLPQICQEVHAAAASREVRFRNTCTMVLCFAETEHSVVPIKVRVSKDGAEKLVEYMRDKYRVA